MITLKDSACFDFFTLENALLDILGSISFSEIERLNLKKGIMTLVDEAFQKNLLSKIAMNQTMYELGGSGANVVRAVAQTGLKCGFASCVGKDTWGDRILERLRELQIASFVEVLPQEITGTVLACITPDGDRTMYTHLGASRFYSKGWLPLSSIENAKMFFTTGYVWDTPEQTAAVDFAIKKAKEAQTCVVVDFADPFAVDRNRKVFQKYMEENIIDIGFWNAKEAQMMTHLKTAEESAKFLGEKVPLAIVKDGENGAWASYEGYLFYQEALEVKVVDTTGAGDCFAGGFLSAFLRGYSIPVCLKWGASFARENISHMGVGISEDCILKTMKIKDLSI